MWSRQVDDFIAHLRVGERSPCTLRNYRSDLRIFAAWFERQNESKPTLAAITGTDLRQFKESLRLDMKPATVNAKLSALRSFLAWGVKAKRIAELPDRVKDVAQAQDEPKWLDRPARNRLLREAEAGRNRRDFSVIRALLFVGLRVRELTELRWRDVAISERKGELTVRAGKGGKWRAVKLSATARQAFADLRKGKPAPESHVFLSREGPLSVRRVQAIVRKYGDRAGIEDLTPHMLRHTCAKEWLESGAHITEVMRLLGHSSIQTTMRYLTPSGTDLQAAVDRRDAAD